MLPCVCKVTDHRRRQKGGKNIPFLFLSHFDLICDLLLNRPTAIYLLDREIDETE